MKNLSALTALAALLALPAMAEAPKGFWAIPGTDTAVKVYGFVAGDTVLDTNTAGGMAGVAGGQGNTGGIVTADDTTPKNQWESSAKFSRFGIKSVTATPAGDVKTQIEGDFYGTSSAAKTFRLRQANGEWNGLLVGQAWSNFIDGDGSPNYIDYDGLVGDYYGSGRLFQVRYTFNLDDKSQLSFSYEEHKDSLNDATGVANHDLPGAFTGQYHYADKWGHVAAAVAYAKASAWEAATATTGEKTTSQGLFSWNVAGSVNFGDDSLVAHVGQGFGFYGAGLTDGAYQLADGSTTTVKATLFDAGYEHFWTPKVHTNLLFSYVKIEDNKDVFTSNADLTLTKRNRAKNLMQVGANVMIDATKNLKYTIEYIYGVSKAFDSNTVVKADGSLTDTMHESKLHLQAKYSF